MKNLINELQSLNVKCNYDEILFIARDDSGQIVWLENGNDDSGFIHIYKKHLQDFKSIFGEDVVLQNILEEIITQGHIISCITHNKGGTLGFEKIIRYKNTHFFLYAIGTNGYIVSAYPFSIKE